MWVKQCRKPSIWEWFIPAIPARDDWGSGSSHDFGEEGSRGSAGRRGILDQGPGGHRHIDHALTKNTMGLNHGESICKLHGELGVCLKSWGNKLVDPISLINLI